MYQLFRSVYGGFSLFVISFNRIDHRQRGKHAYCVVLVCQGLRHSAGHPHLSLCDNTLIRRYDFHEFLRVCAYCEQERKVSFSGSLRILVRDVIPRFNS